MITRWFVQTVTIEPFTGESARGAVYGPAYTVRCKVEESSDYKRGRDGSADRHEVTDGTTIYMPRDTNCPPRSLVTLPSGIKATVVAVSRLEGDPSIRHLKVTAR
ncbi:hypothetical protein [Streptomyces sp.]|uniref:hypothetical protein n=1 Tax=Streptomyces sp. TaxID=1931 RepID=UPI002F94D5A7